MLISTGLKGAFGSLTLGGYDASRYEPAGVSLSLSEDITRDLVVGLQTITTNSSDGSPIQLLPAPIWAFIDSTQAMISLSNTSCQAFEGTFGLVWNEKAQAYLVDDRLHRKLIKRNPTINFTLGNSLAAGPTVDIVFPYTAFDLQVKGPAAKQNTRVFPLQRAQDASQYTLGRTFLQEA